MRPLRTLVFLVSLAVVIGVGVAFWRGSGPLPDPERCTVDVGGHIVGLDSEQGRNAAIVSAVSVGRRMPARAASIALATAFQESKVHNLSNGDRDSVGVFQQRPSQGWGTAAQILDVYYATNKFYDALTKVHGYSTMRITVAAQKVQHSGYPEAYEQHAEDARALASALTGFSSGGRFTCVVHADTARGNPQRVERELARAYGPLVVRRPSRGSLVVTVGGGEAGRRLGWSMAQFLVGSAKDLHIHRVAYDGRAWRAGDPSSQGWQRAGAGPGPAQLRINLG